MKSPRRLLLLEDNPVDAELLRRTLAAQWPDCEVIQVREEAGFLATLQSGGVDLILSDYRMPGFDGPAALALARQECPDTPFLFVSGAIGEEMAIESLRAGATDYVLKDRLARLVPALRRALKETEEAARRKLAEERLRDSVTALERSVRRHEALVNSVDGIVWQADPILSFSAGPEPGKCQKARGLRFTFVSQQAERLLGYPVRRWLEEPDFWQQHIHPEDRDRALSICTELTSENQHKSFEYRMVAADGYVVWLRDIVSLRVEPGEPLPFSSTPGCPPDPAQRGRGQLQGIMVEITARKKAEEKVRRIQAELEQTNRDLTRRNQEIQNFYHTLSHELKTPLTSAREFISIVMDGLAGPLNETQAEYLTIARESCNQLRHCINDLLDATRLETGKLALELKPASLAALAQRVVTTMTPRAAAKNISLGQDIQPDLPEASLDERRMTQIITNLLTNAIKYTPSGGGIVVKVSEAAGRPELLQVSVTDTGCGIPKEEQEHIFDRLYQIKAGDASTEQGVGLGLYLCRELVQLHGGNIWVESEPGAGSRFIFVVPRSQESLRSNLLVIDDDPATVEMLRQLLTAEQYNVRTARNGVEGLQQMRRQTPDLILLDLAMPTLNGPATLKEIRKEWGEIPVIVHTGFADGDLMKQALAY